MSIDITARVLIDHEDIDSTFDWDSIPTINMANGNAAAVLGYLGFSREEIERAASEGMHVTPLDMRARCALVMAMPQFIESTETVKVANMIVFGTNEDYILERVRQILELVEWCDSQGMDVAVY